MNNDALADAKRIMGQLARMPHTPHQPAKPKNVRSSRGKPKSRRAKKDRA